MFKCRNLVVLLFGGVLGCGASGKNVFTAQGFHQGRYDFDVRYQDATQRLLPDDWRIDNYYGPKDNPIARPKTFGRYETEVEWDGDGDGHYETKETLPTYDLRFENRHSAGVIWLRSIPIDATDRDKELKVLMRQAVDSISGGEYVYWRVGDRVFGAGDHLVAQPLEEMPATVAGREAYVSTIELASVDQLKLNDKRRLRHIRLVMIRSGLSHEVDRYEAKLKVPVIIVAGLSDLPEHFEKNLPVFERFVGQIRIGGSMGYQLSSSPSETRGNTAKAPETKEVKPEQSSTGEPL